MIAIDEISALLLCAGLSRRFGPGNKLLAPLAGQPLVGHAAALGARLPFESRIAVVPPGEPRLHALLAASGFLLVENPEPSTGREASLAIGLRAALDRAPKGILILLGDMPHVTPGHVSALAAAAAEDRPAISVAAGVRSPPVLLPAALARQALESGRSVRDSLHAAAEVEAQPAMLADYDSQEDFERSRA